MTIAYSTAVRNARMSQVASAVDGGSGPGLLRIYGGPRPASGGTATTLLAELSFSDPAFLAPSNGVLTADDIDPDTSANATGEATWFRVVTSTGTFVFDGDVGVTGSGADLELNSVNIGVGQRVEITSFEITEGNP